jgi:hypothetical protein
MSTATEQRDISDIFAQTAHAAQPDPEYPVLYLFLLSSGFKTR